MPASKGNRTAAEKLASYERVVEIIKDRQALEGHLRGLNASEDEIVSMREGAYRDIVDEVLGFEARFTCKPPAAPSRIPRHRKVRSSSRKRPAQKARQR